jgi:hypothetical protein
MKTERKQCSFCNGSGWKTCMMCNGTGKQRRIGLVSPDRSVTYELCSFCNGKGKQLCTSCNGRGYTEVLVPDFEPLKRDSRFGNLGVDISTETRWSRPSGTVRTRSTTAPSRSNIAESVIALAVLAMIGGIVVFGFEETLVAAEGFFIFAGWAGLRAADLFRKQESERLETFRAYMAIGFGLCAGLLAAYLLLTTSEGQAINAWVTAQTVRLAGSLFASVGIPWLLELAWRKIV